MRSPEYESTKVSAPTQYKNTDPASAGFVLQKFIKSNKLKYSSIIVFFLDIAGDSHSHLLYCGVSSHQLCLGGNKKTPMEKGCFFVWLYRVFYGILQKDFKKWRKNER